MTPVIAAVTAQLRVVPRGRQAWFTSHFQFGAVTKPVLGNMGALGIRSATTRQRARAPLGLSQADRYPWSADCAGSRAGALCTVPPTRTPRPVGACRQRS